VLGFDSSLTYAAAGWTACTSAITSSRMNIVAVHNCEQGTGRKSLCSLQLKLPGMLLLLTSTWCLVERGLSHWLELPVCSAFLDTGGGQKAFPCNLHGQAGI
jgi:hypothetical protein